MSNNLRGGGGGGRGEGGVNVPLNEAMTLGTT